MEPWTGAKCAFAVKAFYNFFVFILIYSYSYYYYYYLNFLYFYFIFFISVTTNKYTIMYHDSLFVRSVIIKPIQDARYMY